MPAPFEKRVGELLFALGPVRLPDLPKSVAFIKTDGTGILLKHHELQKRMAFLRLVHQRLAKFVSDVRGKEVKVIDPAFPEGAEADYLPFILVNPHLAFRENPVPIEFPVSFKCVQIRQVRQEISPGYPSDGSDLIGVKKGGLS